MSIKKSKAMGLLRDAAADARALVKNPEAAGDAFRRWYARAELSVRMIFGEGSLNHEHFKRVPLLGEFAHEDDLDDRWQCLEEGGRLLDRFLYEVETFWEAGQGAPKRKSTGRAAEDLLRKLGSQKILAELYGNHGAKFDAIRRAYDVASKLRDNPLDDLAQDEMRHTFQQVSASLEKLSRTERSELCKLTPDVHSAVVDGHAFSEGHRLLYRHTADLNQDGYAYENIQRVLAAALAWIVLGAEEVKQSERAESDTGRLVEEPNTWAAVATSRDQDPSDFVTPSPRPPMKHTILFLAANPLGTDRLALDREARDIQVELERSGFRDRFELVTRWAAEPLDLLRELRKLKPTVVHFSGHGGPDAADEHRPGPAPRRDVVGGLVHPGGEPRHGLYFQGPDGRPQLVSSEALEEAFGAAGASVKLVILNACYSDVQAQALLSHVGCVVGMSGSIRDDAARSFAIGFYGGLGERESIAAAYKQGCAAISLQGLHDRDRPQLAVRAGVDASKLVLAADSLELSASRAATAPASQPSRPGASTAASPKVDIGILTIRDDEFRAVLDVFPIEAGIAEGKSRKYALRHADLGNGQRYTIAVLRQVEQGHGEAQAAARDLIEDLAPKLVLVVGIAGGLPSDDVKLGDVVLSTRIQDFSIEARQYGKRTTYAVKGGPVVPSLAADVAILAARGSELGNWTATLPSQPAVEWTRKGQLYGPQEWRSELRDKLEHHYGKGSTPRAPVFVAGPVASSDRLVKDPDLVIPWLATSRDLLAIEMESGGVYRAAQERCPMLAIRGISDIVGLKRADAWTKYACASAAAFTRAFLRTRPVQVSDPS